MTQVKILPQLRYNQLNIIQKINAKSNALTIICNPVVRIGKLVHLASSATYVWPQHYTIPFVDTYK